MAPGFVNDPHSERGNFCPRNFFGLTDYSELQPREAPLVARRGLELEYRGMSGTFDTAHLRSIHKHLFQDVFPWAGELRVVNISKGTSNFGPAVHIAGALDDAFSKLKREGLLVSLSANQFAERAAFYLGRDQRNPSLSRGQRAYAAGVHPAAGASCRASSVVVSGRTGFTQQQMIDASIASHTRGDNSGLAAIIEAALFSTREQTAKTHD